MAAKFRKVDPRIWHDERFVSLNRDERLVALYCITSSQTNRIGIFHVSPGMAAEQIGLSPQGYAKGMARVCHTLKWELDGRANVLYMPTWWKYNSGCGPKTMQGILNDLHELPQTPLLQAFFANTKYLSESEAMVLHTHAKGMPRVSATGEQEQEQEQDIKETTNVVSSSVKSPTPPIGLDASLKKENSTGFRFPMVGGNLWDLPPRKLEEYQATYSDRLDCEFELRKARQWLTDNSSRRPRTARGVASFLTRWLNRANDSIRKTMPGSKVAAITPGMVLNAETGEFVMPKGASNE